MIIYPSIHISGGQCVIPAGYDSLNRSPVLAKRPSNLAKLWEKSGASIFMWWIWTEQPWDSNE